MLMEIDKLPTILDVVEMISELENKQILLDVSSVPSSPYFDEGRFNFVSDRNNRMVVHLMPTSQSPFTFYRGQSHYYEPCIPSLYRVETGCDKLTAEDIAVRRIKICEFVRLLNAHSVYAEVSQNILLHPVALAQHYGLATEYLDITNSKWVAAFFASTGYDWETDEYYPVGRDYGDGYGVMYISKDLHKVASLDSFFERNDVIGYQYFERPSKQSSFGYRMEKGEDFNSNRFFDKIFFRHDLEASSIVFEMSYRQERFIPRDTLSKLARIILTSQEATLGALELCMRTFYSEMQDYDSLIKACDKKGVKIKKDNVPITQYPLDEIEAEWKSWNEYGRAEINSRILPIRPIISIPIPDSDYGHSKD